MALITDNIAIRNSKDFEDNYILITRRIGFHSWDGPTQSHIFLQQKSSKCKIF